MALKKVRVEMDGTGSGTQITDVETGEPITNVVSIRIEQEARDVPLAYLTQIYEVEGDMAMACESEVISAHEAAEKQGSDA